MKKTILILSSAVIAGAVFFACKKTNETLLPTTNVTQTTTNDDVTSRVREFVKKADVSTTKLISGSNAVSNTANYTIDDAVFIIEAANNYLHDDSIVGTERQIDTLFVPITVSTENGQEMISEQNTITAFNSIKNFVGNIAAVRYIMVVDVEGVKTNGVTTQLMTTILSTGNNSQKVNGNNSTSGTQGLCDPFLSSEGYQLLYLSTDPNSAHKKLEAKLDAYCAAYLPCQAGMYYYYTNVQIRSVLGSPLWYDNTCYHYSQINSNTWGGLNGTQLNTYRTNAYNWANTNQPSNTDTKINYTLTHEIPLCSSNYFKGSWKMDVQYGLRVCYMPSE